MMIEKNKEQLLESTTDWQAIWEYSICFAKNIESAKQIPTSKIELFIFETEKNM